MTRMYGSLYVVTGDDAILEPSGRSKRTHGRRGEISHSIGFWPKPNTDSAGELPKYFRQTIWGYHRVHGRYNRLRHQMVCALALVDRGGRRCPSVRPPGLLSQPKQPGSLRRHFPRGRCVCRGVIPWAPCRRMSRLQPSFPRPGSRPKPPPGWRWC